MTRSSAGIPSDIHVDIFHDFDIEHEVQRTLAETGCGFEMELRALLKEGERVLRGAASEGMDFLPQGMSPGEFLHLLKRVQLRCLLLFRQNRTKGEDINRMVVDVHREYVSKRLRILERFAQQHEAHG